MSLQTPSWAADPGLQLALVALLVLILAPSRPPAASFRSYLSIYPCLYLCYLLCLIALQVIRLKVLQVLSLKVLQDSSLIALQGSLSLLLYLFSFQV